MHESSDQLLLICTFHVHSGSNQYYGCSSDNVEWVLPDSFTV